MILGSFTTTVCTLRIYTVSLPIPDAINLRVVLLPTKVSDDDACLSSKVPAVTL